MVFYESFKNVCAYYSAYIIHKNKLMKKVSLLLSFSAVILFANAGANKTSLNAKIDGCKFDLKKNSKYVAQLSPDGKTAIVTFLGNDIHDQQGKPHAQKLNVEYALSDAGEAIVKSVVLEFNEQKFYNMPGSSLPNVSKVEFSKDKKSLVLTANFDCKVQKPQTSEMFEGIIGIQGSIENIKVDVSPSDMATINE